MFKTLNIHLSRWLLSKWFTKLMKSEPSKKKKRNTWIIDESKCLCESEVKKLMSYCNRLKLEGLRNKKFTAVRNYFMVELGLHSGLRVQEMASLKHFNLLISDDKSSILLIGKGNKERSILIDSKFKRKCLAYIKYKEKFGFGIHPDSFLLNNLKDKEISKRSLQKFFKIIIKNAGLSAHYHIHTLRHTYATFLLEATNHNYRFVQKQLGHASIKTTQIYAGVLRSVARRGVEKIYDWKFLRGEVIQ